MVIFEHINYRNCKLIFHSTKMIHKGLITRNLKQNRNCQGHRTAFKECTDWNQGISATANSQKIDTRVVQSGDPSTRLYSFILNNVVVYPWKKYCKSSKYLVLQIAKV